MFPSLKKPQAHQQPPVNEQENHRADGKKQCARPVPNVVFPSLCPQRAVQPEQRPDPQNGRILKLPYILQKSVYDQKPGTSNQNVTSGKMKNKQKKPLCIREAMRKYGKRLTELEQKEILRYSEIWYLGLKAEKIKVYDDEKGQYIMVAHDHIAYRYEVLEVLGKGAFGQVFKCRDHKTNEMVAIKVLHSTWKESKTEVRILEALLQKGKETCAIQMKDHFVFRNHFCITFELLGPDMHALLKKRKGQGFSRILVHRFARSLLQCLLVLYNEKIIHADLKPDNIMVNDEEQFDIKLADFGISCYEGEQYYKYVGTRWYRPPEVLLQQPYSTAMDMWSLGCVLAEFYTGRPIFQGRNELDQLACIIEVLGLPPTDMTEKSEVWSDFLAQRGTRKGETNLKVNRFSNSRPLVGILGITNYSFLDFIQRCLTWDPKKRMTPLEALQHKWIVDGGCLNPCRTHDWQQQKSKDTTKELPFPSFRPGTCIKEQLKPLCEEEEACFQNVHDQDSPKKLAWRHPTKRSP